MTLSALFLTHRLCGIGERLIECVVEAMVVRKAVRSDTRHFGLK